MWTVVKGFAGPRDSSAVQYPLGACVSGRSRQGRLPSVATAWTLALVSLAFGVDFGKQKRSLEFDVSISAGV